MFFLDHVDLEAFWSEEGLTSLPKGVVESLRKVTPPSGLLSFERFCAGLKICLLRYQVLVILIWSLPQLNDLFVIASLISRKTQKDNRDLLQHHF